MFAELQGIEAKQHLYFISVLSFQRLAEANIHRKKKV